MTAHPDRKHSVPSALPPPSRLLLPHVRPTEYRRLSARQPRSRSPPIEPQSPASHDTALEWLGLPLSFDVVQAQLEIGGYQMYAVEKWSVPLSSSHSLSP
ncbi:hypothetical protein P691DRAFT_802387 [Macrolepiota fuliginosa MF-IS2]|uniref:Uncharacterized protein n=1 Tax=Macrolepiota fuliginosa MF-IS2 TaxID=1400762 RepID=A0A9P6C9D8_9AGAR|nr:hypothetical protein P691DRAFT_802387 [Macrolepiota fuliginosa MF-IS2]